MSRKLNIPKDKQIAGLRKAIANRKTPRGFIPSMKKRLAKLTGAAAILFLLCGCAVRPAAAQAPVTIQPTQQTLATNTPCSGSGVPQAFPVNNKNQTVHVATISTTSVTSLTMQIIGVDSSGLQHLISDTATSGVPGATTFTPAITGIGYYPIVQVVVTCIPTVTGTFSINYSASSAGAVQNSGGYLLAAMDKSIAYLLPVATAIPNFVFQPSFGSSLGVINVQYSGTPPTGSTLVVSCSGIQGFATVPIFTYYISSSVLLPIPETSCPIAAISLVPGTGGTGTISIDYSFVQPGSKIVNSFAHLTGTTATVLKVGAGILKNVVIGTAAAGTISFFDLIPSACTGTPSTNVVSVITPTTTAPLGSIPYDVLFLNGICVKASVGMDFTVGYQ